MKTDHTRPDGTQLGTQCEATIFLRQRAELTCEYPAADLAWLQTCELRRSSRITDRTLTIYFLLRRTRVSLGESLYLLIKERSRLT